MNRRSIRHTNCASFVLLFATATAVEAARDRRSPTRPTNLRATDVTAWSVSLAWNPSSDTSPFSYYVIGSHGHAMIVPQTFTSCVFTAGFEHRGTFTFWVFARDGAGNQSQSSNGVTVTLPQDTARPSAPVLTVTEVGATHIALSWSSTDDGPFVFYNINKDGVVHFQETSATSGTMYYLQPDTTYTLTAQSRDNGVNWSPPSAPVVVTTDPPMNDTTPPTTPANLWGGHFGDGSTEFELMWSASTDNYDPQGLIRFDVYLNGNFFAAQVGQTRLHDYGVFGENRFEVIAVDTAGNESAPATFSFTIP